MRQTVKVGLLFLLCLSLITVAFISAAETPPGWTDDIRLTDNPTNDDRVVIDSEGNSIHIAWHHTVTPGEEYQIFYMNSNDRGYSWGTPTQISSSDLEGHKPSIGVSGDHIHVVWEDTKAISREIYYRNSTDGGLNWNEERMLSEDDGNRSLGPRISVVEDDIHVIWTDTRHWEGIYPCYEVYYIRSLDGGISWDDGAGGQYGRRLTNLSGWTTAKGVVQQGETVHILYSDDTDGPSDVYYMVSYDNGVDWEDGQGNAGVGRKIAEGPIDQFAQAIAAYGSDVHVIWVEEVWPGPEYYLYYRRSTDNGATWGTAEVLSGPSPVISNPDISVQGDEVNIVWADRIDDGENAEIYFKESLNGGITWNDDLRLTDAANDSWRPSIVLVDNMKHVVWHDMRDGNYEVYYKRSPDFDDPISEFPDVIFLVIAVPTIIILLDKIRGIYK